MSVDVQTVKAIFLAAVEKPTAAEREAYLAAACGGDAGLRQRLEALLKAHVESGEFPDFAALAADPSATPNHEAETMPPDGSANAPFFEFLSAPREPGHLGRLGHYEIHSLIGQGGMGVVFKALDETLDRIVAVKVLAPGYAANATARRRFVREAKAIAAVVHEHVVTVHAVEELGPISYLVMQYVQGVSLQERLERTGPLEVKEILRIGLQAARGLAAAHAQGIVHRDIKPANILLENGVERVKITDFGLARAVDDASITQSGTITGTPMYMSPEQANSEPVDPRSDLFSLGSVLYALCTGHPPFRADSTFTVLRRVIEDTPRRVREINAEIPDWLEAIIAKLHAKKPVDRFQSSREVAHLLEQHLAHLQQPNQVPMPKMMATPSRKNRNRVTWRRILLAAVPVLAGVVVLIVLLVRKGRESWIDVKITYRTITATIDGPGFSWTSNVGEGALVKCRPGFYTVRAFLDGKVVSEDHFILIGGETRIVVMPAGPPIAASVPRAANLPDNPDEVLPAMAGTWGALIEYKIMAGKPTDLATKGFVVAELVAGKRFLRQRLQTAGELALNQMHILGFDPQTGEILDWYFDVFGNAIGPFAERWDKATRTLTWASGVAQGPGSVTTLRFDDANTITWDQIARDQDGKVETHQHASWTRINAKPRINDDSLEMRLPAFANTVGSWKPIAPAGAPTPLPPEMTVLHKLMGEWQTEGVMNAPVQAPAKSRSTTAKVLGGRFVETRETAIPFGEETYALQTYALDKTYRLWSFGSNGHSRQCQGSWDAAAQRLSWNWTEPDGHKGVATQQWRGQDRYEDAIAVRNPAGQLVAEVQSTSTRQKRLGPDDHSDHDKLQGTWLGEYVEESGRRIMLKENSVQFVLTISGDVMSMKRIFYGPKEPVGFIGRELEGVFRLDPAKEPKRFEVNPVKDVSMFGIYQIQGDELTICYFPQPKQIEYPTEFGTRKGSPAALMHFKRDPAPPVLVRFLGTWNFVSHIQVPPPKTPEQARASGVTAFEPVGGGKFLRGYATYDDGHIENLLVQTYDETTKEFENWYFDSDGHSTGPGTGSWDQAAQTLTWREKIKELFGVQAVHEFKFLSADTFQTRLIHKRPNGEVTYNLGNTFTRTQNTPTPKMLPIDSKLPDAMKRLTPLEGKWRNEMLVKTPPNLDKERKQITEHQVRPVLGGHFFEAHEENPSLPGRKDYSLIGWDELNKRYRLWYFSTYGSYAAYDGTWNEALQTITWKDRNGPSAGTWILRFPDQRDVAFRIRDPQGQVVFEAKGVSKKLPDASNP